MKPYLNNPLLLLSVVLLFGACATPRGMVLERGEASWYGPGFHGKQTANGETYNQNDLTAAHRTLPFDTRVRVENLSNGKTVVVRINDRGPYANSRIIDLSQKAAQRIDMIDSGIASVRIFLIDSKEPISSRGISKEVFTVQVASFDNRDDARRHSKGIRGSRVERARLGDRTVYRVYYGSYRNTKGAEDALAKLRRNGYDGFVKQEQN
ncbi:MAG: septal ring lytic transglycosylase RlpA family protein [Balneolales bacterium]